MRSNYFRKPAQHPLLIITLLLLGNQTYGQSEEKQIYYSNATEVFNVAVNNPKIEFDDKKEYFWYTDFSKIKSTKGGCGGQLLHGNYKLYDEEGNLIAEKNYTYGLKDGLFKDWDSTGNVVQTQRYDEDELIYWKFLNEGHWVEHNGKMLQEGTIIKVYTKWGRLIKETKNIEGVFKTHTKAYYEDSGNLKEEYYEDFGRVYGTYTSYFEDGKIELQGEFCVDSPIEIRTGTWKWYNPDGTIKAEEKYKAEVVKWENGKYKHAGGYIFDEDIEDWVKNGEWRWYKEEGGWEASKKYEWGIEVDIEEE